MISERNGWVAFTALMFAFVLGFAFWILQLFSSGEEAPEAPEPFSAPKEDWRLSQATRDALMDLGYASAGGSHWMKPYPDPSAASPGSLDYHLPARDTKLQSVRFDSVDVAPANLPLDGLHVRVRVRREGLTVDDPSWVVADTDATADLLIEARQFGTRGVSGSDPLSAEDTVTLLAFLGAALLDQVRAIPDASLKINYEALSDFRLKVEWPLLDPSSGPRVVDATRLIASLDEKLRAPRAA